VIDLWACCLACFWVWPDLWVASCELEVSELASEAARPTATADADASGQSLAEHSNLAFLL